MRLRSLILCFCIVSVQCDGNSKSKKTPFNNRFELKKSHNTAQLTKNLNDFIRLFSSRLETLTKAKGLVATNAGKYSDEDKKSNQAFMSSKKTIFNLFKRFKADVKDSKFLNGNDAYKKISEMMIVYNEACSALSNFKASLFTPKKASVVDVGTLRTFAKNDSAIIRFFLILFGGHNDSVYAAPLSEPSFLTSALPKLIQFSGIPTACIAPLQRMIMEEQGNVIQSKELRHGRVTVTTRLQARSYNTGDVRRLVEELENDVQNTKAPGSQFFSMLHQKVNDMTCLQSIVKNVNTKFLPTVRSPQVPNFSDSRIEIIAVLVKPLSEKENVPMSLLISDTGLPMSIYTPRLGMTRPTGYRPPFYEIDHVSSTKTIVLKQHPKKYGLVFMRKLDYMSFARGLLYPEDRLITNLPRATLVNNGVINIGGFNQNQVDAVREYTDHNGYKQFEKAVLANVDPTSKVNTDTDAPGKFCSALPVSCMFSYRFMVESERIINCTVDRMPVALRLTPSCYEKLILYKGKLDVFLDDKKTQDCLYYGE